MYTAVPRIFHNTLTGLLMCAVEDLPFVHSVRGEGTGGGQRKDPRVPSVNIRPTPVCFEFLQLSVQRGGRCWHTFRFCVSRKCCLLLMGPSSSWWQSVKLKSDQTKVREQFSLSGQEARLKWRIAPTTWPFLMFRKQGHSLVRASPQTASGCTLPPFIFMTFLQGHSISWNLGFHLRKTRVIIIFSPEGNCNGNEVLSMVPACIMVCAENSLLYCCLNSYSFLSLYPKMPSLLGYISTSITQQI